MHPIIHHPLAFHIGPFNLPFGLHLNAHLFTGFGVAMVLAFLIAQIASETEMERRGFDPKPFADVTLGALVGGLLGAKIYFAILMHDFSSLFHTSGFVFWGGLVGGMIGTFYVCVRKKLPYTRISDLTSPGLAAAYCVGRTGCWAVGDDYGRPWNNAFAVSFPQGAPPSTVVQLQGLGFKFPAGRALTDVVSVYPTQLFEIALALVMFAFLWRWRDHKHAEGWLFGVYCVLAGTERFIIEFFRAKDDRFFGPFTMAQVLAVGFALFGAIWMYARRNPGPGRPGIYATKTSA